MCIRDRLWEIAPEARVQIDLASDAKEAGKGLVVVGDENELRRMLPVSYTHLRAHETVLDLVCRLLLEKKKK